MNSTQKSQQKEQKVFKSDQERSDYTFFHGIPKERVGLSNSEPVCSLDTFTARGALHKTAVKVDKFIEENKIGKETNIFQQPCSGEFYIKDIKGYLPYNENEEKRELAIATDYAKKGKENQPIIDKFLSDLKSAEKSGWLEGNIEIKMAPPEGKDPERLVKKWQLDGTHPATVMDLSRGSIITDMDDIEPMLNLMKEELSKAGLEIAGIKNRLHATDEGYIDVRVIIKNPKTNAYSEILCLTPYMSEHKDFVPHKAYENIREMPVTTDAEKKDKEAASVAIRGVYQTLQLQDAIKDNGSKVKPIPEFKDISNANMAKLKDPKSFVGLDMKRKTIGKLETNKDINFALKLLGEAIIEEKYTMEDN